MSELKMQRPCGRADRYNRFFDNYASSCLFIERNDLPTPPFVFQRRANSQRTTVTPASNRAQLKNKREEHGRSIAINRQLPRSF
jgi:hypothetical protein